MDKISSVSFRCKYKTNFGSSLFVIGNLKLLGHWDPNNAIALTTTEETYPLWTLKNAFSCPVGTEILYKYIIKNNNGEITWETLPNNINRKKIISKPGEFIIDDEENIIKSETGLTEDYGKIIKEEDVVPKNEKKKKKKGILNNKKKVKKGNNKNDKMNSLIQSNSGDISFPPKLSVPIKDEEINESDESNDSIKINEEPRDNQEIINLKIGLDENIGTDIFSYDINSINKLNSLLFESFLFSTNQTIGEGDRLVFVEEYLPLTLKKNENCPKEEEEDNQYIIIPNSRYTSIENFAKKVNCKVCWVGMLKNSDEFDEIELEDIYAFLEKKMIIVVEIPKKQLQEYNIYFNNILMPTFIDNSISTNNDYNQNYNEYYNSFQSVNKKFAKSLCVLADTDLIMINDMNLCFIPLFLAQYKKNNFRVGLYIHLNFPSSDVFKAFPNSNDIIYSLILCDVIGFHVYQDARNFISVLERVFWIFPTIKNKGYMTFEYLGKYSFIFIKYCGCDNERIKKIVDEKSDVNQEMSMERRSYNNYVNKYKKIIGDKLSIVSIDNAIEMTELILKFNSYKIYLEQNLEKQKKIILIEIISYKSTYKKNLERIHAEVKKIKDEFGEDAIYYEEFNEEEKNISIEELIGIFTLGNILFSLQIWNKICSLVSLYLLVQNTSKIFGVIINESNLKSPKIKSICRINPYNMEQIFISIEKILTQEEAIRTELYNQDIKYLQEHNSDEFMLSYFGDLKIITSDKKDLTSIVFGLKNDLRVMKLRKNFELLSINVLQSKYNSSKCRFFFLDYEETLQSFVDKDNDNPNTDDDQYIMEKHAPSEKLLNILKNLSDNPKNFVYIITGKPRKFLMKWFKDVKNLGFGAEYGCYWKDAHDPEQKIQTRYSITNDWLDSAYSIIKQFEIKTEGSRTEVKDSSICWNFGNSDQYSGNIQASDLTIQLSNILPNSTQLEVVTGKDYVEVKPKNLNKGYFISFILKKFINSNSGKKPDYIFACGDDVSDEEMFKYLNFVNKQKNIKEENIKIIMSTLLKKPSAAQYYVPSPEELLNLLDSLTSSKYN